MTQDKVWIAFDSAWASQKPILKIGRFAWEKAMRFENDKFFKLEWYKKSPYSGSRMIVVKIGSYARRLIF